ncbi:MAG: hypothetical protein HKN04_02235 [Rhodothermaceae bacterium]|nr:hypothetical protein [Rhodothermaceae bacterium]
MKVDLDQYTTPANAPGTLKARREALLHQLGWLADEAEALGPLLDGLPAWALEQTALPEERSVKETLARLTTLDRAVYPRWIEQVVAEEQPTLAPAEAAPDSDVNTQDVGGLLQGLRSARSAFIAVIETVPGADWSRTAQLDGKTVTLYDLALRVVRHDAEELRTLAYRLYEAKLADSAS